MTQDSVSGKVQAAAVLRNIGATLLTLMALGLGLWWQRAALVQWLLQKTVLTEPRLAGLFVGGTQTEIEELGFGLPTKAGNLSVALKGVRATYDWQIPKIEDIEIAEATLRLAYQPSANATTASNDQPFKLPLDSLRIGKLVVELDSPWGVSRFDGILDVRRDAADAVAAHLQDGKQRLLLTLAPDFEDAKLQIERAGGGKILELQAKAVNRAEQTITLATELSAVADWLNGNTLLPDQLRAKLATIAVDAVRANTAQMQFKLNATGPDANSTLQGRFALTQHQQTLLHGNFQFTLQPTAGFSADIDGQLPAAQAFELAKPYLPQAASTIQISRGDWHGSAHLDWQAGDAINGAAKIEANELGLTASAVSIENASLLADLPDLQQQVVKLTIRVPSLALPQNLSAHDLNVVAQFQAREQIVELQHAQLAIFDGSLAVAPSRFAVNDSSASLTLMLQDIDLAQLLASLHYPDISGTGKLNGSLPVTISATGIDLQDGELTGTQPGVLRYLGQAADPNNLAFQALRNLLYQGLKARVSYRPNGDYRLGLRLEGHNPEVLSGHPLAFNLNISGQLPELLQKGLLTGNFERAVIEQATIRPAAPAKAHSALPSAEPDQPQMPPPADRRTQ